MNFKVGDTVKFPVLDGKASAFGKIDERRNSFWLVKHDPSYMSDYGCPFSAIPEEKLTLIARDGFNMGTKPSLWSTVYALLKDGREVEGMYMPYVGWCLSSGDAKDVIGWKERKSAAHINDDLVLFNYRFWWPYGSDAKVSQGFVLDELAKPVDDPYMIEMPDEFFTSDPDDDDDAELKTEAEAFACAKRQANKTGEDIPIYKRIATAHPGKAIITRVD